MSDIDLLRIRKSEIEALYKLNKIFDLEKPLFVYICTALNTLREYMHYEDVALWLKQGDFLELVYVSGDNINKLDSLKLKIGDGIVGRIAQVGYPEIFQNLAEIKEFKNLLKRKNLLNLTFFVVPILNQCKVGIGVLAASCRTSNSIPLGWQIEFLEVVSSIIGHHIELYNAIQKEKERLQITIKNLEDIIYSGENIFSEFFFPKLNKIANTDINILLTGESGTGKSSLARYIHEISHRKDKPFIVIDCASIPRELLEAELFGYEKGAFTGAHTSKKGKLELANGGTVFLDEIGDLPLELQPKILRAIQDKIIERVGGTKAISIDVRFISATNRDLKFMVQEKRFREDLFYRINGIEIRLPPLRERKDEFEVILKNILAKLKKRYEKDISVSKQAYQILSNYSWPGNIRELENVLELSVALDDDGVIDIDDLPFKLTRDNELARPYISNIVNKYIEELNALFNEKKIVSPIFIEKLIGLDTINSFEDLKLCLKKSFILDNDGVLDIDDLCVSSSKMSSDRYLSKTNKVSYNDDLSKKFSIDQYKSNNTSKRLLSHISEIEKEEILKALKKHRWVLSRAARELGLTRRQLEYRIKKYNITP